jgi:predicted aldo/keto reductase-like oxidoreductase
MRSNDKQVTRRDLLKLGMVAGTIGFVGRPFSAGAEEKPVPEEGDAGEDLSLPQVPRRILGKTGKSIPILLVGGGVNLDPRFDPKLAEALRFGANYVDAADCYGGGSCETAVGNFHTRADIRKELWITSKSDAHDPEGFERTLETSLEKMQTDYVDMYYLHALQNGDYLSDELRTTVERLRSGGKMRHFGFSCHHENVAELLRLAAATPWVESVMFRYNFRQYGDKELNDAIDACVKAGVGLIAMKTQGSEASFREDWRKFERTGKWTKHQAVLKAVWADDRITAAVSHMDNLEKLKQNLAAALDRTELGRADWNALEKYAAATRNHACDGCDHLCGAGMSAPIPIGAVMRYLMYHDVYGERERARELFTRLPAEARNLATADFGSASAACPHGVDLARHMERAARVLA